jgi:hypothetical protein
MRPWIAVSARRISGNQCLCIAACFVVCCGGGLEGVSDAGGADGSRYLDRSDGGAAAQDGGHASDEDARPVAASRNDAGGKSGPDSGDEDAAGDAESVPPMLGPCASSGGSLLQLAPASSPSAIAVDSTSVYWTDSAAGSVSKEPVGGAVPLVLAQGECGAFAVAVDTTNVYWATRCTVLDGGATSPYGAVRKMPVGGGSPDTLASWPPFEPTAMAVDGTSVYWASADGTLRKVPIGGGTPAILTVGPPYPSHIALDATSLYWIGSAGSMHPWVVPVMRVPLSGGTPATLASIQDLTPTGFAVDGQNVYLTGDDADQVGVLMSIPLSGGAPRTLASRPASALARNAALGVVVDTQCIYWAWGDCPWMPAGSQNGGCRDMATLMSMPVGGGTPSPLWSLNPYAIAHPTNFAVDTTSLYWTDDENYVVMRLSPK